jgi:predicted N-acetyltransferase YhbS
MADTIERLKGEDFDEAMNTMGTAFGFSPDRDFPILLPQIYRPTDELMEAIYAIRRDGRIVSAVGVHPRDWQVGDTTLKLAGIGGVCTLEEYRGQGLMNLLMERCVDDMKSEGYHLSWLGGQRQRYQYYGYEKCGNNCQVSLRRTNFRHAGRELRDTHFEAMGGEYADRVAVARAYHEAKPIHVMRSQEDFVLYLLSGYSEPWFALDPDDKVIGYLVTTTEATGIREIASENTETSIDILHAWSNRIDKDLSVTVQPHDVSLARALTELGESASVSLSGNWQVYDWSTTLTALMQVKHTTSGLAEGEVRIETGEEMFVMTVDSEGGRCGSAEGVADLSLTPFQAHRALFGPSRPSDVVNLPDAARVLETWAPLPLSFLRADSV